MGPSPARVLLVDEHALFRTAMASAFDADGDFTAVGEASTVAAGMHSVTEFEPDIVLVSTNLAGFTSMATVNRSPHVRLIKSVAVSPRPEQWTLRAVVEAGMDGYVTKDMELHRFVAAVRQVWRGEAFVPPGMLGTLLRELINRNRAADEALQRFMRLTRREKEVLELLVEGCDHDSASAILGISPQTARTHMQNILTKLGVHSRLEAVALAVEHRLVERLPIGRTL